MEHLKKYYTAYISCFLLLILFTAYDKLSYKVLYSIMTYGFFMLVLFYLKPREINSNYSKILMVILNLLIFIPIVVLTTTKYFFIKDYVILILIFLIVVNFILSCKILSKENKESFKEYIFKNHLVDIVVFLIYATISIIANKININSKSTIIFIMSISYLILIILTIFRKKLNFGYDIIFSYLLIINISFSFNISKIKVNNKTFDLIYNLKSTLLYMLLINYIIFFICSLFFEKEKNKKKEIEEEMALEMALQEAKRLIEEEKKIKEI